VSCVPNPQNLHTVIRSDGAFMVEGDHFNYIHEFGGNDQHSLCFNQETIDYNVQKFSIIEAKWHFINKNQLIYFFISNTQVGFEVFLKDGEEYKDAFGLSHQQILEIKNALEEAGFKNFKLIVLNRMLEDSIAFHANPIERVIHFYYGNLIADHYALNNFFHPVSYNHQTVVSELTAAAVMGFDLKALPQEIEGLYEDTLKNEIEIIRFDKTPACALIKQNGLSIGMIRQSYFGLVVALNIDVDAVTMVKYLDKNIYFQKKYTFIKK
jgi:hypothetical protein